MIDLDACDGCGIWCPRCRVPDTSANVAAAPALTWDAVAAYRTELQRELDAMRAAYVRMALQCDGGPWAEHEPSIRDAPAIVGWSVSYRVRPGSWFIIRDRPGSSIGWLFVSAFDAERAQAAHPDIAPAEPPAWAARVMALA